MIGYRLEVDNRCPSRLEYLSDLTSSAVNAVVIVSGMKWEDIVRAIMEIAKERAYMPTYTTCVTDMMRMSGFATVSCSMSVGEFLRQLEDFGSDDKYILKINYCGYLAVLPADDHEGYAVKSIRPLDCDLSEVLIDKLWRYIPGTDNRTGIKTGGFQIPSVAEEHKDLVVFNMNPQDHNVGDCSVRALCAALECTWGEAIDMLAAANRYTDPVINSLSNINNALIKLDFERHKALKRNNRLLTGKEFAALMTHTYHNNERIFAYVGRSHCAAFLPFKDSEGRVVYKVQDTWDSTDRKIGDYWVIPPKAVRDKQNGKQQSHLQNSADVKSELTVGDTLTHKIFGTGTIIAITETSIEVDFPKVGVKKLSKEWTTRA